MTIGALDLSLVTAHVCGELTVAGSRPQVWAARLGGRFDIDFSGEHPHKPREEDKARVSFYLFHVNPDPAHRNTFPLGGPPRAVPEHPLALTLHYLLSAQAHTYDEEQQAMSIALKCLHEHPVMTATVPGESHVQRFTVTLEPQTADEIGRLWLALATPLQLSAVYRAEVVFLQPEERVRPVVKKVLEPRVHAFALSSPSLASAPTAADVRVVTGSGFDPATIALSVGGQSITVVNDPSLHPGEAFVLSSSELQLRLPAGTIRGRYALRVTLAPGRPVEEVELFVEDDVP